MGGELQRRQRVGAVGGWDVVRGVCEVSPESAYVSPTSEYAICSFATWLCCPCITGSVALKLA